RVRARGADPSHFSNIARATTCHPTGCVLDPFLSRFNPDFLAPLGVIDKLNAGDLAGARQIVATHFRERVSPTYFPDHVAPMPAPDPKYDHRVADQILTNLIQVRYFQAPHQFGPVIDWLDPTLPFEDQNVLNRHAWVDVLS